MFILVWKSCIIYYMLRISSWALSCSPDWTRMLWGPARVNELLFPSLGSEGSLPTSHCWAQPHSCVPDISKCPPALSQRDITSHTAQLLKASPQPLLCSPDLLELRLLQSLGHQGSTLLLGSIVVLQLKSLLAFQGEPPTHEGGRAYHSQWSGHSLHIPSAPQCWVNGWAPAGQEFSCQALTLHFLPERFLFQLPLL